MTYRIVKKIFVQNEKKLYVENYKQISITNSWITPKMLDYKLSFTLVIRYTIRQCFVT